MPGRNIKGLDWKIGVILILLVWGLTGVLSAKVDSNRDKSYKLDEAFFIPHKKLLKPAVMGYDNMTASIFWVEGLMYFANSYLENKGYPWLAKYLDIIIHLDSNFVQAYEIGPLMLEDDLASQKKSLEIYKLGVNRFPESWKLRIYAAITQMAVDSNYLAASEFLQPLIRNPDAPDYMKGLAATLLVRGGHKRALLGFLIQEYVSTGNSLQKSRIVEKIADITPSGDRGNRIGKIESLLEAVEKDPSTFKRMYRIIYTLVFEEVPA